MNELNQPTLWTVDIKGYYASMNNIDLVDDLCIDQLLNVELGVAHLRPIHEKWFFLASLGGGVYTDLSEFSGNNILTEAAALFIWTVCPNLQLGFGIGMGNAVDYTAITPLLSFKWEFWKRFDIKIELLDGLLISTGMKLNDNFTVRILTQSKNINAVVNRNSETRLFTQSFIITGLQPEIYIHKMLSIPITVGFSSKRNVYYKERDYISFAFTADTYSHFNIAPYLSIGLKLNFGK
jgi:hypothetical protein